jgi:hypothetical protein
MSRAGAFLKRKFHLDAVENIKLRRFRNAARYVFGRNVSNQHSSTPPNAHGVLSQPDGTSQEGWEIVPKKSLLQPLKRVFKKAIGKRKDEQPPNAKVPHSTGESSTVATPPAQSPVSNANRDEAAHKPPHHATQSPLHTNHDEATHEPPPHAAHPPSPSSKPPLRRASSLPEKQLTSKQPRKPSKEYSRTTRSSLDSYFLSSPTGSEFKRRWAEYERLAVMMRGKDRSRKRIPTDWVESAERTYASRTLPPPPPPRVLPIATLPRRSEHKRADSAAACFATA